MSSIPASPAPITLAWGDNDHHGSIERFDMPSPQIDNDDDDNEEDHIITDSFVCMCVSICRSNKFIRTLTS